MTEGFLGVPGQEPVDPRYARFRDGWSKYIIGKPQYLGLRWSPWERTGEWLYYKLAAFDFIDFGVSGPESPLESRWQFTNPPTYRYEWKLLGPNPIPELWAQIESTYERVKTQRPEAVWNPYDGSWREVHRRSGHGPPPPPPPPSPPLDPELERRLNELYRLHGDRLITDEVLKQRILELLREYG